MGRLERALWLASQGFYIFPLTAGAKAPPVIENWQDKATRDPAIITRYWTKYPEHNIGIYTGRFQDDGALLVVDVDRKGAVNGDETLLRLELEGWEMPDTYSQHTPTGGRHLVFRVGSPVRQGTHVLGPGLDIRSRGGYIVGVGSVIGSGQAAREYAANGCLEVRPAPDWLIARCADSRTIGETDGARIEVNTERAQERARHYLEHEAPLAIEGAGGDETTYKVAARCKDFGLDAADTRAAMAAYWNARCQPPWSPEELAAKVCNAHQYGRYVPGTAAPEAVFTPAEERTGKPDVPPTDNPYAKLNKDHAFVIAGGGAHILWETTDAFGRYKLEHLSLQAFHEKFKPVQLMIGTKTHQLSDLWLEWKGRREYDGLVFMPEQPPPARFFNLWRGFAVKPAEKGRCHAAVDAFLEHARINVCHDHAEVYRWLLGYFAHLVQRPWDKPLVALVFRGSKGVGKNALVERIGALLGCHFLLTSNQRYLLSNFNVHLENCLLFALDEAFWSGDKRAEGVLKDLITGKDHVIEPKSKEIYTVANKTRVVIIGNEEWLVPATHDERRFAVFDVGDGRKQDRRFFQAMREGMEAGGYEVLLRYLLDFDLTGIDVNAAPATKGLLDQKQQSMNPLEQWWFDCLESGMIVCSEFDRWPGEIECERFRAAFRRYVKERQIHKWLPEDRAIGRIMKACAPGLRRSRAARQSDGSQPYIYTVPPLVGARQEWECYIGHVIDWPTDTENSVGAEMGKPV